MARTNEQLTQQEIDVFHEFCSAHRIISDESEVGQANGNLIGGYIAFTWREDITPVTLAVAFGKLRDQIVFYTPAQWDYRKIADENNARANALNVWFQGPGNSTLVRSGDEGFQNQSALLAELRGREITSENIQNAIGRAGYKKGLHYVPTISRSVDPRQHADDGTGFMPKSESNLSAREFARRAASAASGKSEPTPDTNYRVLADAVQGSTHSKTENIQRLFVMTPGTSQIDYEKTYYARRRAAGL